MVFEKIMGSYTTDQWYISKEFIHIDMESTSFLIEMLE